MVSNEVILPSLQLRSTKKEQTMKRKLTKQSRLVRTVPALCLALVILALVVVSGVSADQPEYEPAYFNGKTVTMNAIELPQHAPLQAQADLYLVVYPIGWEELGAAPPQCNPCDHGNDGIGWDDFHDHVLDSIPSDPGHGEFRTLWHVFAVAPAYSFITGGDPANDDAVGAAFASHLPAKSEAAVDALVDLTLPDGSPVAVEIDTNSYFLCSVVNPRAAK
jgi:hypothetical protein